SGKTNDSTHINQFLQEKKDGSFLILGIKIVRHAGTALSARSPARFNSLLTTNPLMAEGHPPNASINPYLVNCDTGCTAVLALCLLCSFVSQRFHLPDAK